MSSPAGLAALERRVAADLDTLGLPAAAWPAAVHRAGEPVLDVAVVGAGMNGIAVAGSLLQAGVRNIRLLDASAPGREGPWTTTARMETLRSPKTLPGPSFGLPSLTFRAWYTAGHGDRAWAELGKIANQDWQDYLGWLQRVLALPVEHGARVSAVRPDGGLLRLTVDDRPVPARRVVLATGRAGAGGRQIPDEVDPGLWPELAAHTADPIDPAALAGRRVAVLGGGASAWDAAATVLEHGAARADLYIRRPVLPQVNKFRAITGPGFVHGWADLPPAQQWQLAVYLTDRPAPVPHETVHRALRRPNLHVHLGTPVHAATRSGDRVRLDLGGTDPRVVECDFLVLGTGYRVDLDRVPELADLAPHVRRWADRRSDLPVASWRPTLAAYPVLGPGFELRPAGSDAPPEVGRVHLLNAGSLVSHGPIGSDIPGVDVAGARAARAIVRSLFREDLPVLRDRLSAFDVHELAGTPFDADLP
ncbi:FAD-dependent oxidoreductase [Nakamurella sp.]|uniref:FAD-dependent oxidoreductase n=1 Tax=Nakamurella sp. TaxID=1869182 RepID=UPI003B3B360C